MVVIVLLVVIVIDLTTTKNKQILEAYLHQSEGNFVPQNN